MYIKRVLRCISNVILFMGNLQISDGEFAKHGSLYYFTPISNYIFVCFPVDCLLLKNDLDV